MRAVVISVLGAALLTFAVPLHAQSVRPLGIDGMMQTVKAEGQSSISGLGLRCRLESEDLPEGVIVMPTIEYWRDLNRIEDFGVRSSQSDFTLGADARYDFGGSSALVPYAGAGLGLHLIRQEFQATELGIPLARHDHTKLGPDLLVGVQLAPVGWLQSFAEAKYAFVHPFGQFKLNWGMGVNFR